MTKLRKTRSLSPTDSPHQRTRSISYLSQDETKRLFSAIKTKRDRAIFLTAYRHGLRASEIGMLQRTDADLKAGRLTIQRAKGSLSGIHAMQPDEIKALRAYLATRADSSPYLFISNRTLPISRFTLLHYMQTYAKAAGIPDDEQKFHALRHSIATHLLDAGADLSFVKDWLGYGLPRVNVKKTHPSRRQAYAKNALEVVPCPSIVSPLHATIA